VTEAQNTDTHEKIGVLGGSFNPIHNGHINMACGFAKRLGLDRVLIIPVWSPPHKSAREILPAKTRLEMCRLACRCDERLEASDIEIVRGGTSYTADTLRELKQKYKNAQLYLITGTDMFLTLESWRNFAEISRLAALCACARSEGESALLRECAKRLETGFGARCVVENFPVTEVSSTQVRRLLKEGGDAAELLPPPVFEYIKEHKLYNKEAKFS
jgi:nicotinate-nucleotide adenylyltransferase